MFVSLMKKHVSVPGMSRVPWKRHPHLLPNPRVQSGCRRGSFMSAEYFCILVEQKLFCCNPRVHGSASRQRAVDVISRSARDST
jgi:hypothetical protein